MKTIGQLKLNQLSKADLMMRQMNALRGGLECTCNCECPQICNCTTAPPGGLTNSTTTSSGMKDLSTNVMINSALSGKKSFAEDIQYQQYQNSYYP